MEKKKMEVLSLLSSSSFSVLQRFNKKHFRVSSSQNDLGSRKFYQKKSVTGKYGNVNVATLIRMLGEKKMPDVAQKLVFEMRSEGCLPNPDTLSALMICYAENGLISDAQAVWDEIINSSFLPTVKVLSDLMDAYGKWGRFDEVGRITREVTLRKLDLCPQVYLLAISCFGEGGQLEMMKTVMKEMVSSGFKVDSATGNAFVIYYTRFGSITEMETAYGRLKRSGILLEKEGIRAMASAYIKKKKFYQLGEFLRDVGLGRRNEGNFLWNLLLLSYAANFKMKSMQREFLKMVEAGFSPDLTTFNIRALAFSRMSLFWDLHVSLEHMKHEKVVPDLVTYGCVVDTFMDRKLGRNLNFALSKMNIDGSPFVSTDPLVFEVLGKGDFHSSSELLLESKRREEWTYKKLVAVYLKKKLINCWTMVLLIHLSYLHGPERELFIPFVGSFLSLTRLQLSGFVLSEMNFEIVDAIE